MHKHNFVMVKIVKSCLLFHYFSWTLCFGCQFFIGFYWCILLMFCRFFIRRNIGTWISQCLFHYYYWTEIFAVDSNIQCVSMDVKILRESWITYWMLFAAIQHFNRFRDVEQCTIRAGIGTIDILFARFRICLIIFFFFAFSFIWLLCLLYFLFRLLFIILPTYKISCVQLKPPTHQTIRTHSYTNVMCEFHLFTKHFHAVIVCCWYSKFNGFYLYKV